MKKSISLILALILIFSVIPYAFAEDLTDDTSAEENKKYTLTLDAGEGIFSDDENMINSYYLYEKWGGEGLIHQIELQYSEGESIDLDSIAKLCPYKDDSVFNGWNSEIPEKMPANDITVKANWKLKELISLVCINYNTAEVGKTLNSDVKPLTPHVKVELSEWTATDDFDKRFKEGDIVTDEVECIDAFLGVKADDGYRFSEDTVFIFSSHYPKGEVVCHTDLSSSSVMEFSIYQVPVREEQKPYLIFYDFINSIINLMMKVCALTGKNLFPKTFEPLSSWQPV